MIGTRVLMNPKTAKWYLDNPDLYEIPSTKEVDMYYEDETLVHLMCCLGQRVYGKIITEGASQDYWGVEYKIAGLRIYYFVDRKDLIVVK